MPLKKFIAVFRPVRAKGREDIVGWEMLPGAEKVEVWDLVHAEQQSLDAAAHLVGFHVQFLANVARGCRVSFVGDLYAVIRVSDSPRLRGIELLCEPVASGDGGKKRTG